ncbi:MAG: PAS domain S-box protein [Candidatus Bipolaricaulis sp.]|nr:PAS domain S-box protein [Candidatus Bipolaricaulis sp.]
MRKGLDRVKVRAVLERRHTAVLVGILAVVTLAVAYSTIEFLYRTAVLEQRARLTEMARSQARLIEAVARNELETVTDVSRATAATVGQVAAAHSQYESIGRTGEFTLGVREGDTIRFLLSPTSADESATPSTEIPWDSNLAEPMRRALRRESGTIVALDYRGRTVLAAYEPVDVLDLGIVAKIDLSEIQRPFRRAAIVSVGPTLAAILLGAWVFTRVSRPLLRRMEEVQERYEDVVETMGDGLAVQDADGRVVFVNDRLCQMLGRRRRDVLGRLSTELFSEESAEMHRRQLATLRLGETRSYEAVLRRLDESPVHVLVAPRRLRSRGRSRAGTVLVISEITDLKVMEAALRREKERAQLHLDIVGAMVVTLDSRGRIELVNRRAIDVLGYDSARDLVGRDWFSTCLPEQARAETRAVFAKLMDGDVASTASGENAVLRRDGETRLIVWHNTILRDAEGRISGTLSSGEDITELRRHGERLTHLNAVLRAIRNVNQLITRETDRDRLLSGGCRELVATKGVDHAWAVEVDSEGRPVRAAEAGIGESFEVLRGPMLRGELPRCCRRVLAGSAPVVLLDPANECAGCPAHNTHADTAAVGVPLRHEERIFGVLVVGVPRTWAKDDEQLSLFREVAGDLAFALRGLDTAEASRRAEAALETSEARYRSLFENAILGIYQMTSDGRILAANPALVAMLGYDSLEDLARANLEEGRYSSCERSDFRSRLEREGRVLGLEAQWRRRDGSMVQVRENAVAIRDADGRVLYYAGTVEDVTDRRAAAEALRQSEARYRSLFENAILGIYQTTPDGRILAANAALVRMLGFSSFEDLAARNLEEEGYAPEYSRSAFKERLEREGAILGNEAAWERADGSIVRIRENAVTVRDAEGRVLYYEGTVEDVTARWEAEQARRWLEAQLRQTQKLESIGTLASGIAHEINNPLTGIINFAELISARADEAKIREFASEIVAEGNRVATTVRSLLSFARQEKESHSPARIADIAAATLSLIGAVLRKDQVDVVVDIPADTPQVRCRSQQIEQVLMNLLTNARDALNVRFPRHDERKRIEIRARGVVHDGGRWVRVTVEDGGIGIPRAIQGRIFDPFFTTKPRDQGTGLGLAISFGIIRDHRGTLTVESEEGVFTRFAIELPAYDEDANEPGGEGG